MSNDCRVVVRFYDSNEQLIRMLSEETEHPDVIVPSSYAIATLEHEGILGKLKWESIPNARQLDRTVFGYFGKKEVTEYGVPYLVAPTGIAVKAEFPPKASWAIFDEDKPSTLLNDRREVFAAAMLADGIAPDKLNSENPEHIRAAYAKIRSWRRRGVDFESVSYAEKLRAGQIDVSHAWPGDVMERGTGTSDVAFLLPEEGFVVTCDFLCIPSFAANADLAHKFINHLCEPSIAAGNMNWTLFRAPNAAAMKLVDKALLEMPSFAFPNGALRRKSYLLPPLSEKADRLHEELWNEIEKEFPTDTETR